MSFLPSTFGSLYPFFRAALSGFAGGLLLDISVPSFKFEGINLIPTLVFKRDYVSNLDIIMWMYAKIPGLG